MEEEEEEVVVDQKRPPPHLHSPGSKGTPYPNCKGKVGERPRDYRIKHLFLHPLAPLNSMCEERDRVFREK